MTPTPEQIAALATNLTRLRRIAHEAEATYVGRHWPSMADMRRDGIGFGLVEDRAHERFIRRYLDTFQPAFVVDLLDRFAALADWLAPTGKVERLRAALEIIAAAAESAPDSIPVSARNIARAALAGDAP